MTVGKIENGLERSLVKHRLNCYLMTDRLIFLTKKKTLNLIICPELISVWLILLQQFEGFRQYCFGSSDYNFI